MIVPFRKKKFCKARGARVESQLASLVFFPYLSSSERVKNSNSKNRSREPQIHKINTE